MRIAVLTVSDTRSLNDDKSGSTLSKRIESSGHQVVFRDIVKDDRQQIRSKLEDWIENDAVDVIISTGELASLAAM